MRATEQVFVAAAAAIFGIVVSTGVSQALTRSETVINGLAVHKVTWKDSKGLRRSVSLKRQGRGNPGNGGYAIQFSYQVVRSGKPVTVWMNAPAGDGFGYFVSHERYRRFTDGSSATIAGKIFGQDDSPLGRNFPVTESLYLESSSKAIARFRHTYPRYGTVAPNGIDPNTGDDSPRLGTNPALFKRYSLPISLTWAFQDGRDYPRITVAVRFGDVPGPDRVSFDIRAPYGKINFDGGSGTIRNVRWGDRYHFVNTTAPITRNSSWTWSVANTGARYTSLTIGPREFGLVEPRTFAKSALNDGYAEARGRTSSTFNGGQGCPGADQLLPCDWEWPYQSTQYELPYDNPNGTTTSEKIAWGSAPYYGTSMSSTYDGTTSVPFRGFPSTGMIAYSVCVVFDSPPAAGQAKRVARDGGTYSCASAPR